MVEIELRAQYGDGPECILQTVCIEGDRGLPIEIRQSQVFLPEKAVGRPAEETEMLTEKPFVGQIGKLLAEQMMDVSTPKEMLGKNF